MTGFIRRVVTGHDKNGKAVVLSDELAPSVKTNPLRPGRPLDGHLENQRCARADRRGRAGSDAGPRRFIPRRAARSSALRKSCRVG